MLIEHVQMESHIRHLLVNRGPFPVFVSETVANGIFGQLGGKERSLEHIAAHGHRKGHCLLRGHHFFHRALEYLAIKLVVIPKIKLVYLP